MIGRAGTGVDNVDIPAATQRGIIVANAPESNSVAAAEHTLALALALFRNVPQAHGSLVAGRWDRAKFKGAELYGKTLGVIGFGRIGQLVAKRAQSFEMDVVAFDKFVSAERFRELGVEGARELEELLGRADLITLHVPKTPETIGLIDAETIAADEGRRAHRQLRPRRAGRPRRPAWPGSSRASSPAPRSTSSPRSPSPSTRSSPATTSSSPRTSAPRRPRPRTAPASSPPSR